MVPHHHQRGLGLKIAAAGALAMGLGVNAAPAQEALRPYDVVNNAIPKSLTGTPGDPVRGRAIVIKRESTCLLCHSGPFPEERFQGDLSPSLTGTGSRWTEGELRLRMVDAARLNPATIMPSFYRVDGLNRVAPAWKGKPILSAEQIEDVVSYLATLRN
jgi:L-cysteine S-thiosulfotransferase